MNRYVASPAALAATLAMLLVVSGCNAPEKDAAVEDSALSAPVPAGMVRGTVLETMDSGGYTYVLIDTAEDQRWAAAQQTSVNVGDVVQVGTAMPMADFTSKTLDRTFDVLYFVDGLQNLSAPVDANAGTAGVMPEGHPALEMPAGHPSIDGTASNAAADSTGRPGG